MFFRIKLVDFGADAAFGGGDDKEHELSFTPIIAGWNSFDIPLTDFVGLTTTGHIAQLSRTAPRRTPQNQLAYAIVLTQISQYELLLQQPEPKHPVDSLLAFHRDQVW